MPIATNRFNDPALGQAFSNLTQMFAPASGADLAGYAAASAKKAEAARLAELFNYAKDPNYNQAQADRMGVLGGLYAPTQSFYSVDQGNMVTRRGQDITASTSLANNAADNARALAERQLMEAAAMERLGVTDLTDRRGQDVVAQTALTTNAADNARAIEQTRLGNTKDITTSMLAPVAAGATRFVPSSIAEMYGTAPTQTGVVNVGQGETSTLPNGEVITGAAKPLSEAEVRGAILNTLPASDQRNVALSSVPVEQIVGPDGQAIFANRTDAVGQRAVVNKGSEAKPVNYQTLDGRRGTATVGPDGSLVDTQTKQVIPEGSVTFGTNIQGSEAETGLSTKTNQTKSVQIRGTVTNMSGLVNELETLVANNPAATGVAGDLLSFTQDAKQVVAELGQKFGGDPNMPITEQQAKALIDGILPSTGNYDPVYRKAAALTFELAYANAKLNNPGGEVSRFALERELEQLGQGLVGNDKALLAVIDVSKGRMKRALSEAEVLSGASQGITADDIVREQPAPTVRRQRFDENGNPVQ